MVSSNPLMLPSLGKTLQTLQALHNVLTNSMRNANACPCPNGKDDVAMFDVHMLAHIMTSLINKLVDQPPKLS